MLEMLDAARIRHITILDTHMDAMTVVVAPLRAIVHVVFDYAEGYIELVDERGFVRFSHRRRSWGGEPLRHICTLQSIRWNLECLAIVGMPPHDCPLPPVQSIGCLTIGVTQYDATPPAFALQWPCPQLADLRLARSCYKRTDGSAVVVFARQLAEFVAHAPVRELHLDSMRLDGDAPSRLRVVHTASVLTPVPYGGDLPYRLDQLREYDRRWRLRRERKRQSQP